MSPSGRIWLLTREPSGASPRRQALEARVRLGHPGLEQVAVGAVAAGQADDLGQAAVQLGDVAAAGGLVQPVDVLGDDRPEDATALQVGDGVVGGVRLGVANRCQPMNERAQ